jgi:hypothetical protein
MPSSNGDHPPKQTERARLESDVEEFLRRGGKIQQIESTGETARQTGRTEEAAEQLDEDDEPDDAPESGDGEEDTDSDEGW